MRRVILGFVLGVLCFGGWAEAQEYPVGEIFGGFSIYDGNTTVYGWQASGAANMTEHIGIVADFGGHYDDVAGNSHQYLFGPRFRTSRSTWVGFGHALFGTQRLSASGFSINAFTMGFGGGVDLITGSGFGIRLAQFDWLPTRIGGAWFQDQSRIGFGVLVPLGN
jgi:hypothetical protein